MRSKQAPIHSGYGAETTAREALGGRDLTGAVALATGGHAGIGLATTRALAEAGATVLVGARAVEPARAGYRGGFEVARSLDDLKEESGTRSVQVTRTATGIRV